jgi:hypothetical protein
VYIKCGDLARSPDVKNADPGIGDLAFENVLLPFINIINLTMQLFFTGQKNKGVKGYESCSNCSNNCPLILQQSIISS